MARSQRRACSVYQKFLCSFGNLYSLCQLDSLPGISSPCVPWSEHSHEGDGLPLVWRIVVIQKAIQNHSRARAQVQAAPELPPRTPSTSQAMPRASCPGTVEQSPAPSSLHLRQVLVGTGGSPRASSRSSRRSSRTLGRFVKCFYTSVSHQQSV